MKRSPTMRNLMWRGNKLSVTKEIPPSLRRIAGKRRFTVALDTGDLAIADRLKHAHLAEFERQLGLWRRQLQGLEADPPIEEARSTSKWCRENP